MRETLVLLVRKLEDEQRELTNNNILDAAIAVQAVRAAIVQTLLQLQNDQTPDHH